MDEFQTILTQIALPSTTPNEILKVKDNLDRINTQLAKVFRSYIKPEYSYRIDIVQVDKTGEQNEH